MKFQFIAFAATIMSCVSLTHAQSPCEPELVSLFGGGASEVEIVGTTAYVANTAGGLYIFDISDPSSPVLIGSLVTPGWAAFGLSVIDGIVYVANGNMTITIIDVSQSSSPVLLGSLYTGGTLFLQGDRFW